ncbi:MAG: hypothetical protein ACI9R3_000263 [Verrucomicrobiales bacterium]
MSEFGQRTGHALEVARTQIVERQAIALQMTGGQLLLDGILTLEQPVHRVIEIVLIGITDGEGFRQRRVGPPQGSGEFGLRFEDSCDHHTDHQIALTAAPRGDEFEGLTLPGALWDVRLRSALLDRTLLLTSDKSRLL